MDETISLDISTSACVIFFFAQIANLNSGSGLHDSPIHVQSNTSSAGWIDHHTTTLIIRSCYIELVN